MRQLEDARDNLGNTGQSYPRAFFDPQLRVPKAAEPDDDSADDEAGEEAELVSLEDADAEATKVPEADVDVDVDAGDVDADDDDDTFLEADEDEDDGDVTGLIDGELEADEES